MSSWEIALPERDTPADVAGSYYTMTAAFGRELGDLYDQHMRQCIGPGWLTALESIQKKPFTLHDPDFVLSEPYYNSQSPLRDVLPHTKEFYDDLGRALNTRHAWAHYNEQPTLERLEKAAKRFQKVAAAIGLGFVEDCKRLRTRVRDIREGRYLPAVPVLTGPPPEELSAIAAEQERLEEALAAARAQAEAAQRQLDKARSEKAAQGVELEEAAAALARAAEERESLAAQVERLNALRRRSDFVTATVASSVRQTRGPVPPVGAAWPYLEEGRELRLTAASRDLVDPTTGQSLIDELGEAAESAVARWLTYLPGGGGVRLTNDGHALAWVGPTLTYLGRIDEQVEAFAGVQGFFTAGEYTVLADGDVVEEATGELLSAVSRACGDLRATLRTAMPGGGEVRVTTEGVIARYTDDGWQQVAQIAPGTWFAGG